jgi:hypothetical protein
VAVALIGLVGRRLRDAMRRIESQPLKAMAQPRGGLVVFGVGVPPA